MIRPVQRLPSISLLLNDLLKHTRRAGEHKVIVQLMSSNLCCEWDSLLYQNLNHIHQEIYLGRKS
jgi:hypothetical protein